MKTSIFVKQLQIEKKEKSYSNNNKLKEVKNIIMY